MEPIRSWTTTERVVRASIFAVAIVVFTGWCYWDRFVGYPQQNVDSMVKNFPDFQGQPPPPNPEVIESVTSTLTRGMKMQEVEDRLGPPAYVDDVQALYFGEAGALQIPLRSGKLASDATWKPAEPHSPVDLQIQYIMAVGLTPVSLLVLLHLGRILTTRAELSDAGLKVRGKPLVPFEAMTSIDIDQYAKKGWVDLRYELNGRNGRVRLDDYVYREFPAIIREICMRTGLESPLDQRADDDSQDAPAPPTESSTPADSAANDNTQDGA